MDSFLTIQDLLKYTTFISVVFTITEFIKNIKFIKKIPTKYFSFFISLVLLITFKINTHSFTIQNILLDIINSIFISLGANGIYNFNAKSENSFLDGKDKK